MTSTYGSVSAKGKTIVVQSKSESEQYDGVFIRMPKKDFIRIYDWARLHDGRNTYVKFLRETFIGWCDGYTLLTKGDICMLHVVACLTDGREPINRIILKRISPKAIKILKSWHSVPIARQ